MGTITEQKSLRIVHAAAEYSDGESGFAVVISPDSGFKYASFFGDILGDEGKPKV